MAAWMFCVSCGSDTTSGDFDDAFWWNATTGQSFPLYDGDNPAYVPQLSPGDTVYWAVQVNDGDGNGMASDLRAAVGRKRAGATISSPFQSGGRALQNAGGTPAALSVPGTAPTGSWVGVGPYTVVRDGGRPGMTSRYEFVLTATLTNGNQFGEDPEMDVQNGM